MIILFLAFLILYFLALPDLVMIMNKDCNTNHVITPIDESEKENDDDDNDSMIVNTSDEELFTQEEKISSTLSNSIKCIQENTPEIKSTTSNKSVLFDYLTATTTIHDDVSYTLAQSLSRVTISNMTNLKLPKTCTSLLTNAYRVSTSVELRNFILHNIHAVTPLKLNLEPLAYYQHVLKPTQDVRYERISVSLLEKLNRLQAELWLTLPLFNTRRNSNSSVSISPTTSTATTTHSSHSNFESNHSTTNTSVTTYQNEEKNKLFNFTKVEQRIQDYMITANSVIQFQTGLYKVKATIQEIIIKQTDLVVYQDRFDQVNYAIQSIIKNYNLVESVFFQRYQSKFIFYQLHEFIKECLKGTQHYIHSIMKMGNRQELDTLEEWIALCRSLLYSFEQVFTTEKEVMYRDVYVELFWEYTDLNDQYMDIYRVWSQMDTIKSRIQHEMNHLSTITTTDDYLSNHYDVVYQTLQHCNSYLHRGIQHDLAATTEAVIKQQENVTSKYLSSHEKIINTIVESVHLPLQKFKNKIMSMTLTLKKYENKQTLRKNLHEANDWLKEYQSEVIAFNLMDSTWSPQNRIRQEEYVDLRMKYERFILIKYNQICNALVIYEDDCGEEYKVFIETLQAKCDQVNKLLKFTASIQQHQKDVLVFMNSAEKHKKKLVNVKNQQELLHWQDEAKVIYKELFSCISWPTMLESPHGKIMYKYCQDLYLNTSTIKIDFISFCKQANNH